MKTSYLFSLLLSLLFLCSCSTKKVQPIKEGRFIYIYKKDYKKGLDIWGSKIMKEELILKSDSTFDFISYADAKCSGTWKYVSKDEILIKCFEPEHFIEKLVRTYPNPDIKKLKVINENKLKMPIERTPKENILFLNE